MQDSFEVEFYKTLEEITTTDSNHKLIDQLKILKSSLNKLYLELLAEKNYYAA